MSLRTADVDRAREQLSALAAADVSDLSDELLLEVHAAAGRLGRLVTTVQARLAGEVARRSAPGAPGGGLAKQSGFRNPHELIARNTGGTKAGARRLVEAGSAFVPPLPSPALGEGTDSRTDGTRQGELAGPRYPRIADAQLAGELSVESAGLMASGLDQLRDHVEANELARMEARWVERAAQRTATEVRRMVDTAVAHACRAQ